MKSAHMRALLAVAPAFFCFCFASAVAEAQTVSLDDFEAAEIRVINPVETVPELRLLWSQYENGSQTPGSESVASATAHDGTRALRVRVNSGNLYLQFYTHNGSQWKYLNSLVQSAWTYNTYNRMRLWIRVPQQTPSGGLGQHNLELGTYYRASSGDPTSAESGGNHHYHFFNIPYTGEWHQIILDTHPNHIRGQNGNSEWGDRPYPVSSEPNRTYFDLMTRFYLDFHRGSSNLGSPLPADFYIDDVELYRESNAENVDQVYSLNGVYVPAQNRVRVGWMRRKDQETTNHEVRYSFQNIHAIGFSNATSAGTVAPLNGGAYNGMAWESTSINVSGQSVLYVAIRPVGATLFRQIAIPLTPADSATPSAPSNLRVVP